MAPSSLYRLIQMLNKHVLKDLNLRLRSKPVRLEGDEEMIRIFITQLVYELTERDEWPFPTRVEIEPRIETYTK